MFLIGGVVPLILLLFLAQFLAESLRYEVRRGRSTARTLARIDPTLPVSTTLAVEDTALEARSPVRSLFSRRWVGPTVLLWFVFALNGAEFYALQGWMPTLVTDLGHPTSVVVAATSLVTVGGIVAPLMTGPAMDRLGAVPTLTVMYLLGFVVVGLLGLALGGPIWLILLANFIAGCLVSGGQKTAIAFASVMYPARLRSTGVGWALGKGRGIGGTVGPLTIGLALAAGWSLGTTFAILSIGMLAAAIGVFAVRFVAPAESDATPGTGATPGGTGVPGATGTTVTGDAAR